MKLARLAAPLMPLAVLALAAACEPQELGEPTVRKPKSTVVAEPPPILRMAESDAPFVLLGPFRSLMSRKEALALLDDTQSHKTSNQAKIVARGHCPGQQTQTITVDNYEHLGQKGRLRLRFHDDRLLSCLFTPPDYMGYRERSQQELGIPLRSSSRHLVKGVWVWAMPKRPVSVSYEDSRLARVVSSIDRACTYQWQQEMAESAERGG